MAIEDAAQYICTHPADLYRFTADQWIREVCGRSERCEIENLRFSPAEFREAIRLARGGQSGSAGLQRSVRQFCAHPPESLTPLQKKVITVTLIILGVVLTLSREKGHFYEY